MNAAAKAHLAKAKEYIERGNEYIERGNEFYRKAKPEIEAALGAGASLREVSRYLDKSYQWVLDVKNWDGTGTLYGKNTADRQARQARQVLREASPETIADELLNDPAIRANVAKAQQRVYSEQAETLREAKREREVERKGGEQEHAEFTRRQRIGEVVSVARGAASGLRFVAGQAKTLNLADEDSGVADELAAILGDIDGFVSMVRSYLSGEKVSDEDIAALIGGGDE